jgi:hypothetical protein
MKGSRTLLRSDFPTSRVARRPPYPSPSSVSRLVILPSYPPKIFVDTALPLHLVSPAKGSGGGRRRELQEVVAVLGVGALCVCPQELTLFCVGRIDRRQEDSTNDIHSSYQGELSLDFQRSALLPFLALPNLFLFPST